MRRPSSILVPLVLGGVLLFGLYLRSHGLATNLFFGDEWHTVKVVQLPLGEVLATFDRFGTGVGYPALARVTSSIFGSCLGSTSSIFGSGSSSDTSRSLLEGNPLCSSSSSLRLSLLLLRLFVRRFISL